MLWLRRLWSTQHDPRTDRTHPLHIRPRGYGTHIRPGGIPAVSGPTSVRRMWRRRRPSDGSEGGTCCDTVVRWCDSDYRSRFSCDEITSDLARKSGEFLPTRSKERRARHLRWESSVHDAFRLAAHRRVLRSSTVRPVSFLRAVRSSLHGQTTCQHLGCVLRLASSDVVRRLRPLVDSTAIHRVFSTFHRHLSPGSRSKGTKLSIKASKPGIRPTISANAPLPLLPHTVPMRSKDGPTTVPDRLGLGSCESV